MNNKIQTCNAVTSSGKKCKNKAGSSGFCNRHKKKGATDLQKQHYTEAVDLIKQVCSVKGWHAEISTQDPNSQFAEISIWKRFGSDEVMGVIYLTVDGGVQYRIEKTSFYGYGQKDLLDAISLKFGELEWLESKKDKKEKDENSEKEDLILTILGNFDKSVRQLKRRYDNRTSIEINDEYDAQDFLHAILRAYFSDVRPEEYTPSYAGSASKVDFLLKFEKSVIEIKYATEKLREKKLGEQLILDIKKYQTHPDCQTLYCLVYDPEGVIHNPAGFENDLSGKHNDLVVKVLVVPH